MKKSEKKGSGSKRKSTPKGGTVIVRSTGGRLKERTNRWKNGGKRQQTAATQEKV